jgi:hypothetical protein
MQTNLAKKGAMSDQSVDGDGRSEGSIHLAYTLAQDNRPQLSKT